MATQIKKQLRLETALKTAFTAADALAVALDIPPMAQIERQREKDLTQVMQFEEFAAFLERAAASLGVDTPTDDLTDTLPDGIDAVIQSAGEVEAVAPDELTDYETDIADADGETAFGYDDEDELNEDDDAPDYASMTRAALLELADERGIEIEGTGSNGYITRDDVLQALEDADA